MPGTLLAIPPLARTIIYYTLGVGNVVVTLLVATGHIDAVYLAIVSGLSGLFFGVAANNVSASPKILDPGPGSQTPEL